ncbi:MAG: pentapeptide repeat-containing protein [Polyangiales bacterium]
MSTDLYGVRVLALDPSQRRVRLRVFVAYETRPDAFDHTPLPWDRTFFVRVLSDVNIPPWKYRRRRAPIDAAIPEDRRFDEAWIDANAWRYIERFERAATRNEPLTDPPDEGITLVHYERAGCWEQEPRMMQADFDVWVTKPAYIAHLELGMSWATTAYATQSDEMRADEAPDLPDFSPMKELFPFGARGAVRFTALSHDGAYLAANSSSGHIVVYETRGWTEVFRSSERAGWSKLGFVAGRSSLLCRNAYSTADKARLIDVARGGTSCKSPRETLLDRDGRLSFEASADGARSVVGGPRLRERARAGGAVREWSKSGWTSPTVISGDGKVVAGVPRATNDPVIALWNADTGEELARWRVHRSPQSITLSPDGRFVAYATDYDPAIVVRASDGAVVRRDKRRSNAFVTQAVHWDPRGRFVVSKLEPWTRSGPCHILVAPVGASKRGPLGPKAIRIAPARSKMNRAAIAAARLPGLCEEEFTQVLARHRAFLDAGGQGVTYVVRRKRGVPIAYYEAGERDVPEPIGAPADLSFRPLPKRLVGLDLAYADLTAVDGQGIDASRLVMVGATATDANFELACFRDAELSHVNFKRSNLRGADLRGADLRWCNFERCDLTGADFTGARFGGLSFKFAILDGIVGFGTDV